MILALGKAFAPVNACKALPGAKNAAQRQKHPVPEKWGGIGRPAVLRSRAKPFQGLAPRTRRTPRPMAPPLT